MTPPVLSEGAPDGRGDGSAGVPAVSVIVAVHDVADHIGPCLRSLAAQTDGDFEAPVIDDGSTDGSGAIAREVTAGDSRFRVITQENRGLSGARNSGLALARAPLVAFLDGDDRLAPGFLAAMRGALAQSGADWVACGLRLVHADGSGTDHPAIHNAPPLAAGDHASDARSLLLGDCLQIVDHFPSAWNKLYRRDLIGDLRFVEGTWFEDHEWFWSLAARSDRIAYLPRPLYLHSRDRPGQITAADDDRALQQIAVLDRLAPLIRSMGKAHADAALARLALRLIHERALALRSPGRRARFLQAGRAALARLGAAVPAHHRGGDRAAPARAYSLAVAIVDQTGSGAAQDSTIAALDRQSMQDFSRVTIGPEQHGMTLQDLLRDTDSRYLAFLQAGDAPEPDALAHLVNALDLHDMDLAVAATSGALSPVGYHDGWRDNRHAGPDWAGADFAGAPRPLGPVQALWLHPHCAARVFSRALLDATGPLSRPLADPLFPAELALRGALAAGGAVFTPLPLVRVGQPLPPASPAAIAAWAGALDLPGAPQPGWRATLAAQLLQDALGRVHGPWRQRRWLARAWLACRRAGLHRTGPAAPPLSGLHPRLRQILKMPRAPD